MTEEQKIIFANWVGDVIENTSLDFIAMPDTGGWIVETGGKFDNWCDKLFFFGKTPKQAAAIVQRAYKLYINQ